LCLTTTAEKVGTRRTVDGREVDVVCYYYHLDPRASFLPRIDLDPEERALLLAVAEPFLRDEAFPYRDALRLAVRKLRLRPPASPLPILRHPLRDDPRRTRSLLRPLGQALSNRKEVTFAYARPGATPGERIVRPYGLFLKAGHWYLCGHDRGRDAVRVFRVSRISSVKVLRPRKESPDYEVPAGFDLRAYAHLDPLRFSVHAPLRVTVRVDDEVAHLARALWGPPRDDVPDRYEVETTNLPALVSQVLALGERAEVLAPARARKAMREAIDALLEVHGG
ncbi:MAG: WYL domain-containing protein, partial [Deltaproteobacteria bacterium]